MGTINFARAGVSSDADATAANAADRTLAHERRIDASPERVHAAFADAARLARWWGPAGFTNRFETCDFRPGGVWIYTMVGPDGTAYPNRSEFAEVGPQRIVIRHLSGHYFELTVTLAADGDGTLVGWRQCFESAAECKRIASFVRVANEQNLDRLAAEVTRVT
jgi:hypothetical protein